VATAGQDGTVRHWPLTAPPGAIVLAGHTGHALGASAHPELDQVASAGQDGHLRLWSPATGRGTTLARAVGPWHAVAHHPRGRYLAASHADGRVVVYDLSTEKAAHVRTEKAPVWSLAWSRDGRLATGALDGEVAVWSFAGPALSLRWRSGRAARPRPVQGLAWSPGGKVLAATQFGLALRRWEADTGKPLPGFEPPVGGGYHNLDYSPDGKSLAVAWLSITFKGEARLLDAQTGKFLRAFAGQPSNIQKVAFSRDGKRLATGDWDGNVRLWDTRSGEEALRLAAHKGTVWALAWSADGRLITAGSDGLVKVWDGRPDRQLLVVRHDLPLTAVAYRPDGKELATAGVGGLHLFAGESERLRLPTDKATTAVAWSPAGNWLAAARSDGGLRLLRADGEEEHSLPGHPKEVSAVAYRPGGGQLASGGADGTVRLWDVKSRTETRRLSHGAGVQAVAWSPDGRALASGGGAGRVRFWSPDGRHLFDLDTRPGFVNGLAFRQDGRAVAAACSDGAVRVWALPARRLEHVLRGHKGPVLSVAWSADGRLASAGADRVVRVWSAEGKLLLALRGHTMIVLGVAFHPDGRSLVSVGRDRAARLWDVSPAGPE
jgi:WD40 repeat protein